MEMSRQVSVVGMERGHVFVGLVAHASTTFDGSNPKSAMPSADQVLVRATKSVSQVPARPAARAVRYRASLLRKFSSRRPRSSIAAH